MQESGFRVNTFRTRDEMGRAAARDGAAIIARLLAEKSAVNVIFAAAPSQNEVLAHLAGDGLVDFTRVNAFHMDEYIGVSPDAPQRFGNYLRGHIFGLAPFRSVHYIDPTNNPEGECERYSELLAANPPDVVFLGVGENGHIAFNDPPVADFCDPKLVKLVELDEICRRQQVNDGCFENLDDVPHTALTLTIPALTSAAHMVCVVPGQTKAKAVKNMLTGPVGTACPASILREHADAALYLDQASAALL